MSDQEDINVLEFQQLGVCRATRTIYIPQTIETGAFYTFDIALGHLESESDDPVTVNVNSYGGVADEALAIASRIKDANVPVFTICYGTAQSAATLILASGARRYASKFATAMSHQGSYELVGEHNTNKVELAWKDRQERAWASHMEELTKKSQQFWLKSIAKKPLYMNADKMLELGLVDEII